MQFDHFAKTWDTEKRINRAKIIASEIANHIPFGIKLSAMEFGCGTGLISFNLHDKLKEITLVDSSEGMIDVLNTKIKNYQINNMYPCLIDLQKENTLNKTFDLIYHSMVLHHIPDSKAIMKAFYQLLNHDGILCIVDLDKEDGSFHRDYPDFNGHNGFLQEELKIILTNAGFMDVVSKTFYTDVKLIEGQEINYSLFIMTAKKR